jgi:hypothetical protein
MREFEEKCDGNYIDVLETLTRISFDAVCGELLQ